MSEWGRLDAFLATSPADVGCGQAMEMLHLYVELVHALGSADAEARHPGVTAHLASCGPCREDFSGLLAAVTSTGSMP
jgi:hypothetical protein